ncbi:hypothetical protein CONPUDRAFT_168479 [Coniophora puteana RWD-64-598 SS2]|uniref:U3 small nucleolar RNA-associated protein 10 n=1 Tax=Coniophora puteana (strain RWD-64-598) TaxID=741705 RepID=A0A5M3MC81_CONPW|nr:uncharacterized protein CONPUDRAFT_168479 [Coniophora puteana RWD-64-598 SS2]EIW76657.1 hypothetical protein CONPUDRAFT_168479 [Coniophora puteana RWD-64-598 SS2]
MPSSLATQLATTASLNSALLNTTRRQPAQSYLFSQKDAEAHDLDSIHALASSAYTQLSSVDPKFDNEYEQSLFSDAARATDRTLQPTEFNDQLDRTLRTFLGLLGPWLMDPPAGKILEWLVKRYRINEFNVEDVLALFLPYHDSPHFAKMLSILHIKSNSRFGFLLPFKSTAKPLPRTALIKGMVNNKDVARFVAEMYPNAIAASTTHRALLAFQSATMHDYISSVSLDESILAMLLPSILAPLQNPNDRNAILSAYVLASTLSHRTTLTERALVSILKMMVPRATSTKGPLKGKNRASTTPTVSASHFVQAAVAVCAPQEGLQGGEEWGKIANGCLNLRGFSEAVLNVLPYLHVDKFIYPLLEAVQDRITEPVVSTTFETIFNTPNPPLSLVKRLVSLLIHTVQKAGSDEDEDVFDEELPAASQDTVAKQANVAAARTLLAVVHQRYFGLLREVIGESGEDFVQVNGVSDKKAKRKKVGDMLGFVSASHPLAQSTDINDLVVASTSAEKEDRVTAVQGLYKVMQNGDIHDNDMASISSALLARIYDSEAAVLHALYDSSDLFLRSFSLSPSQSLPTSVQSPKGLLDALQTLLFPPSPAPQPSRTVIQAHIVFLAGPFLCMFPDLKGEAEDLLWPFLLASRAKARTAVGVWGALKEGSTDKHGRWLKGCVGIWEESGLLDGNLKEKGKDDEDAKKLCKANLGVASKVAENILSSHRDVEVSALLSKLHDPQPHGRALAYLVARALLLQSSGGRQVRIASQVLKVMRLNSLDSGDQVEKLTDVLDEHFVGMKATMKPHGSVTLLVLQTSVLALIPAIELPEGPVDWIGDADGDDKRSDAASYVSLIRTLYTVITSARPSTPSTLSIAFLQALFTTLKDASISFLCGLLLSSDSSSQSPGTVTRTHALLHALAFLRAHTSTNAVDFQTILPSLLAVLLAPETDKRARGLVFECLKALLGRQESAKNVHVYGLDTIYGTASGELQYLEWKDLSVYLQALVASREQLVQDPNYIKTFHQQHLGNANAKYRRRVLCYLLSHVLAHPCPGAKLVLLEALGDVTDATQAEMLLPAVNQFAQNPESFAKGMRPSDLQEYSSLIVHGFLMVPAEDLNEADGEESNEAWKVFVGALETAFHSNAPVTVRTLFGDEIEKHLFSKLNLERQVDICTIMLCAGLQGGDAYLQVRERLKAIPMSVPVIVQLLAQYEPIVQEQESPNSKRPRLDSSDTSASQDDMPVLTLLAEIISARDLPGSLDLISRLMDTLAKVVQYGVDRSLDASYTLQTLMSALENASEKIKENSARSIRLDVLVEIIRTSDSPQTFHQALLLIATLSRLTPGSVLHNVMPIFTFMGSNIFHRDDAYSFRVVQKTIENVVPVMASSLKDAHEDGLALYIGASDFLRVFTDASNHIPRHRRTSFFSHLVEVLGPAEFLAPVIMLLVDKNSNRISRQNAEDVQNSLSLAVSVLHHFSHALQLHVLSEVLLECRRLALHLISGDDAGATLLDFPRDEEHPKTTISVFKRRIQALVIFIGYAVQPYPLGPSAETIKGANMTSIVNLLIDLMTIKDPSYTDVLVTVQATVPQIMGVISASDFLKASAIMLKSNEDRVQTGSLGLLSQRISNISDNARRDNLSSIISTVEGIQQILSKQSGGSLVDAALHALKAIGSTISPGEENALTATIPLVMKVARARDSVSFAMAVFPSYVSGLGPRVIPHFRSLVAECLSILRDNLRGRLPSSQESAVTDSLETLRKLLASLPTFFGDTELTQVISLYLESSSSTGTSGNSMASLARSIAKSLPAKVLLPVMQGMWLDVEQKEVMQGDVTRLNAFFDLLKRSIRSAPRPDVLEQLKALFKIFLESFSVVSSSRNVSTLVEGESTLISAFIELVVKLNENAFKPLFRRFFDWAFADERSDDGRKVTFCHVYGALLDYFKGLMNPYMSTLLHPLRDALKSFSSSSRVDSTLWTSILELLTQSFNVDDGVFWRDDRLRQLASPLVAQAKVCIELNTLEGKTLLGQCLSSMVDNIDDDSLLKNINLELLMHTRSEEAQLRIYALTCAEKLWREHGGKLLGFVAETATFISECAEDENDTVVREAHQLKNAVERVAGSISGL